MSRTQSRVDSDTPYLDGQLPIPGIAFVATTGATTFSRVAAGEFSLHCAASATAYVTAGMIDCAILRTGVQDFLQEQFGSARAGGAQGLSVGQPLTLSTGSIVAGSGVTINVLSTVGFLAGAFVTLDTVASGVQEFTQILSITSATAMVVATVKNSHTTPFPITANLYTTPGGISGIPPFSGVSQLTPPASRPKGILIKSLSITYLVGVANISAQTISLTLATYQESVAPTVTTLIASAANGLPVAFQATPHVLTIPVPVANQAWLTTFNSQVAIEFDFTTGTSGTVDILGATLGCSFNFN